jgi:hypothetical protein
MPVAAQQVCWHYRVDVKSESNLQNSSTR